MTCIALSGARSVIIGRKILGLFVLSLLVRSRMVLHLARAIDMRLRTRNIAWLYGMVSLIDIRFAKRFSASSVCVPGTPSME